MSSKSDIAKEWQESKFVAPPFLFKKDEDFFRDEKYFKKNSQHQSTDIEELLNLKDYSSKDNKFHLGLLPNPFHGDIFNARIYILMLNPGVEFQDYFAEKGSTRFKEQLLCTTYQKDLNKDYPFILFNPEFLWHSGAKYWLDKFKDIIQYIRQNGYNYFDALGVLSKLISTIQLLPYHSNTMKISDAILNRIPSVIAIKEFVREYVVPEAKRDKCLIIIPRSSKLWDISPSKNIIIYPPQKARSASLLEKSEGGKAIIEFLKNPEIGWKEKRFE